MILLEKFERVLNDTESAQDVKDIQDSLLLLDYLLKKIKVEHYSKPERYVIKDVYISETMYNYLRDKGC